MTPPDPFAVRALLGPAAAVCRRAVTGEHGIALPPFHDHHVHAHLIDLAALPAGGIAAAVDLGGDPTALARREQRSMPRLAYAGAFLTAPGGYPSGRPWAPDAIVREVVGHDGVGAARGAETAVDDQVSFGASVIKVALDATAGPVLSRAALAAVVAAAHAHGLAVVAHVEGAGMAELAVDEGVDALAHVPFSELLDDAVITAARDQVWLSTLTIHDASPDDRERAAANAAAFFSAGGRLLYGTDLGNGDRPAGLSVPELTALRSAGLSGAELVAALGDPWPLKDAPRGVATFVPGPPPMDDAAVPAWLAGAVVVPTEELVHDGR